MSRITHTQQITQGPEQSTSPLCLVILSYFSEKLCDHESGLPPGHTDRDAASAPSPNCPKYGTLATVGWPTDRRALVSILLTASFEPLRLI